MQKVFAFFFTMLMLTPLYAVQVKGVVLLPTGKPASKAVVALRQFESGALHTWTTNSRGRFAVDLPESLLKQDSKGLPAVAYLRGYGLTSCRLAAGFSKITLFPSKQVKGRVIDTAGQPVTGAGVSVECVYPKKGEYLYLPEGLKSAFTAKTDENGWWTMGGLPPHSTAYFAVNDTYYFHMLQNTNGQVIASLDAKGGVIPTIEAKPAAVLNGRVVSKEGLPVPGVRVGVEVPCVIPQAYEGTITGSAVTGADGSYQIGKLPTGAARITVSAGEGNLAAPALEKVQLEEGFEAKAPDITISLAALVTGSVTEAKTGKPLPFLYVSCVGTSDDQHQRNTGANTTRDGSFCILAMPGSYTVYLHRVPQGYQQAESFQITTTAGETSQVAFKVKKIAAVKHATVKRRK